MDPIRLMIITIVLKTTPWLRVGAGIYALYRTPTPPDPVLAAR